ncbi:MAG: hypothetical protein ACQEQH_07890 [Bacillota bacterium]
MNIITNLAVKIIFFMLFYIVWQNSSQNNILINNSLIYFYLAAAIFAVIIDRIFLYYKTEKNDDSSINIIKRFRFIILLIPLIEYIYFIRSNKYITVLGIIIVFGVIIFNIIKSKTDIKIELLNIFSSEVLIGELIKIIGFTLILNAYYSTVLAIIFIFLRFKIKTKKEKKDG